MKLYINWLIKKLGGIPMETCARSLDLYNNSLLAYQEEIIKLKNTRAWLQAERDAYIKKFGKL